MSNKQSIPAENKVTARKLESSVAKIFRQGIASDQLSKVEAIDLQERLSFFAFNLANTDEFSAEKKYVSAWFFRIRGEDQNFRGYNPVGGASLEEEEKAIHIYELGSKLGLLVVEDDTVRFVDPLQHYFCLKYCMAQPFDIKFFKKVTDFTFAQTYKPSNYEILWKLWAEADRTLIDKVINLLKKASYYQRRADAAQVLGMIGSKKAVEPLIHALKSSNEKIRKNAALALSKFKDPRSVEPFLANLNDKAIQSSAIMALGISKDKRAIQPLMELSQNDDKLVRHSAVLALGYLRNKEVVELLVTVLQNKNEDWLIRATAAESLGRLKDKKVLNVLIEILKGNDEEKHIKASAAKALGELGYEQGSPLSI